MDISFSSKKQEKTFNADNLLQKEYGKQASPIKRRMAVLQAAHCLAEVPTTKPDRCHPLKGNKKGQYAVDLKHPYRLTFKPVNDPVPVKEDGSIDLMKVTAVRIIAVEDYH